MKNLRSSVLILAALVLAAAAGAACGKKPAGPSYESLLAAFADPPAAYRSAPLWVWNDDMTREEIERQLEDFKARGIGGAFIHPRPGLITPYLGDAWFSLCAYAVEVGKRLGLKIWIYDENSYPSGFAGGHVPAALPGAVLSGLRMRTYTGPPPVAVLDPAPLVVLRRTLTGIEDVTGRALPAGPDASPYYVFDVVRAAPSPWHGGFTYVDLMRRDVTEKFLDLTLNGYKRVIGDEFGLTVPGVFQDEAEIGPAGGREAVNYTPAIFAAFQTRGGYDLRPNLVSLFEETGSWKRVRHDFYATLLDLFIENWAQPYYAYATENKLVFTGHYWEHEWPRPRVSPDNLAMAAYAHMPGIDMLMNEWSTAVDAQFGNARSVREIRSAANQLGRERTLSETYGASGWDLTFADQKRIGDWEYALGVNFLNQHLSYATIKGARKRDHPLSFSDHEPWWPYYNTLADYFGRLSAVLSRGQQQNRILVIEPTTTAWMYYSPAGASEDFRAIGRDFQAFVHLLEAEQIEYDLASERTLREFGSTSHARLNVGSRSYSLVILPPGLRNLEQTTADLIRDYLIRDGKIVSWVAPPDYVNGILTEDIRLLQDSFGDRWLNSGPGGGFDKVRTSCPPAITFDVASGRDRLFHQRRVFDGGQIVFLVNSDAAESAAGRMSLTGGSAEEWDPFTGQVKPYPFAREGGRLELAFSLPPGGSLLLCVRDERTKPVEATVPANAWEEIAPEGDIAVEPLGPNVLTLDYCDLVLKGRTEKDLYFYDAQRKTFQAHGLDRNPWDSAVQYKSNILDLDRFPADSGFEAVFPFRTVKGDAKDFADLKAVVERPGLFRVFINGREIAPAPGEWWLDRAFGVFPIGPHVVSGRNTLTVRARPFTIHSELEPVYLLGDFRLAAADRGFEIRPPAPLRPGSWKEQGWPFYGAGVRYRRTFVVPDAAGASYRLRLGPWLGATAEVFVGGKRIGPAAFPPYEVDLTGALASGANDVSVVVYGTLRNTLGPFHNDPPLGRAWPGSFQQGAKGGHPPGAAYSSVDYGLFQDFKIERRMPR